MKYVTDEDITIVSLENIRLTMMTVNSLPTVRFQLVV